MDFKADCWSVERRLNNVELMEEGRMCIGKARIWAGARSSTSLAVSEETVVEVGRDWMELGNSLVSCVPVKTLGVLRECRVEEEGEEEVASPIVSSTISMSTEGRGSEIGVVSSVASAVASAVEEDGVAIGSVVAG
jgi:hypothetical protein